MAKLYLKFEQAVLKEFSLAQGVVTIGRLPDNLIQIDNLAVSGHHAKIYFEADHYTLEDNNSLNGTFVNGRRVSKVALKDGDEVMIGKHVLALKDEWHEDAGAKTQPVMPDKSGPMVPTLESTVVLDTKKAREMLARGASDAAAAASSKMPASPSPSLSPAAAGSAPAPAMTPPPPPTPARERTGTLMILSGKTEQSQYTLTGKLSVIGKSDMASIKLKGWFAPKVAAVINRRDGKYFIAASERDIKVKVNDAMISGQQELKEGDVIEVAKIRATFGYAD
jgi:pSer/pThr/pTyr-binding forkhead associated (FHA) protein